METQANNSYDSMANSSLPQIRYEHMAIGFDEKKLIEPTDLA